MTFQIDTGDGFAIGRIDYCQTVQDAARDNAPDGATDEDIAAIMAKLIVADLIAPKTSKTARNHFARYWPLIRDLPDASYDFVFSEFAERLAELR